MILIGETTFKMATWPRRKRITLGAQAAQREDRWKWFKSTYNNDGV
jgi:hypothetical protein